IGRQALLQVKGGGITRKLCTFTLEGDDFLPIYGGEAIYLDGKVVSRVRSGGFGYTVNRNIIYAYLPLENAKTGARFEVDVFEKRVTAEVTAAVLVDPKGERLRA
ncbi:MAG: glycine cleavage T C-terminal barrel domain-containing protein, partial [Anaerolineales bacterium]